MAASLRGPWRWLLGRLGKPATVQTAPTYLLPGRDRSRTTITGVDASRVTIPGRDRSLTTIPAELPQP